MIAAGRPLPRAFDTWCRLASDVELLALLDLVRATLQRRGYVEVCSAVTRTKIPREGCAMRA